MSGVVSFQKASVRAIEVMVGSELCTVAEDFARLGGDTAQLERIRKTIGLAERRVAAPGVTALDLGEAAARRLDGGDLAAVDGLIFVTQTPDHFQPNNAALLHGRLGLREACAVMDVNQGCSGWVYGLWLAHLMVEAGGCTRVLLVCADTLSRCVHPMDRSTVLLFGDAASATLVGRAEGPCPAQFLLRHRGAEASAICVPAGAFRQPPTPETAQETTDADGNTRSPQNLAMDGAAVFNFTLRDVPPVLSEILAETGTALDEVAWFVLHQANRYLLTTVARRAKLPLERVPMGTVEAFGNVSSSSIPLALAYEVATKQAFPSDGTILAAGFGVGLSTAAALLSTRDLATCRWSLHGG